MTRRERYCAGCFTCGNVPICSTGLQVSAVIFESISLLHLRSFLLGHLHHVPDITTNDGFLDVVALGNLLELGEFLDRRFHLGKLSKKDAEEHRISRFNYHSFQKWFLKEYSLVCEQQVVSPSAVFQRSICEFAAALVLYKRRTTDTPRADECSPKKFQQLVEGFFANIHPHLSSTLKRLLENEEGSLHWEGPTFAIRQRLEDLDAPVEAFTFSDWALAGDDEDELSSDSSDEEPLSLTAARCGQKRPTSTSHRKSLFEPNLALV
jgi:hypothetical protein